MKAIIAAVMLLLCSVGIVRSAGEDSTFGLILRELFKLQSEVNAQRSEIGKLRAEVETQKSEAEKQQTASEKQRSEIERLGAELETQKSVTEKKLGKQQTDVNTLVTELGNERTKSDELQKQVARNSQLKSVVDKQQTVILRLVSEQDKQHSLVQKLQGAQASSKKPSTSYIRWGRTRCDGDSTAVYKGYAAGSHHREGGSGSNYLCLHENPQWKRYVAGLQHSGTIYGVQYDAWDIHKNNVFSFSNNGGRELATHSAPCVMCNAPNRSTVAMIPARTECPAGWNKEYGGYLVSGYRGHAKTSFICWDEAPETGSGGSRYAQTLIYHTEVHCGTLPCSTYINGYELTCVVCSK